jgi:hypothetical protein
MLSTDSVASSAGLGLDEAMDRQAELRAEERAADAPPPLPAALSATEEEAISEAPPPLPPAPADEEAMDRLAVLSATEEGAVSEAPPPLPASDEADADGGVQVPRRCASLPVPRRTTGGFR